MTSLIDALPTNAQSILKRLAESFGAADAELSLVGGPIRDLLLERESSFDLDLTTNAVPAWIREFGMKAGADHLYDIGERFGTIGFVFGAESQSPVNVEITTYRAEHYPDSTRHPEVIFGESLEDDLSRRDFTINAIALNLMTDELIDPFDGQLDLYQSRIRAVGDPHLRFNEDPLRLLRAARFVGEIGFVVEQSTKQAMSELALELSRISVERIYVELTKLLCGQFASHGLEVLLDTGLFQSAMPELTDLAAEAIHERTIHREKDLWEHTLEVVRRVPARPIVRWSALLHDAAKPQTRSISPDGDVHFYGHEIHGSDKANELLSRLKADKRTVESVTRIVELHARPAAYDVDWTDSAVRRLVLEAGDVLDDLLDLSACDITSANERKVKEAGRLMASLRSRIARIEAEHAMSEMRSPLDGDELMAIFKQSPGRWIADVKDHLRELVIDGELDPGDKLRAQAIAEDFLRLPTSS